MMGFAIVIASFLFIPMLVAGELDIVEFLECVFLAILQPSIQGFHLE